jgi:hypothetical protein
MSVIELSRISLPPPGLRKPIQLLLRKHQRLRTCIPGLEGTFMSVVLLHNIIASKNTQLRLNYIVARLAGFCEHGNETSRSTNSGNIPD